jgi:hypothetical protein
MTQAGRRNTLRASGMPRHGPQRLGPAIARFEALVRLPALQRANADACDFARGSQPRAALVRHLDGPGQSTTIFQADHSASPLLKTASTFFVSTKSAAASASARSLRCS